MAKRRRNPTTKKRRAAKLHRNRLGHFVKRKRKAVSRARPAAKKRRRTSTAARRHTPAHRTHRRKALKKIPARTRIAGLVRLTPRTGAIMPYTRVANPRRKKHHRRNPSRKHHRRARRRRNPSFGGVMATVKSTAAPMVVGGLAGLGAGFVDAKLLGSKPIISIFVKLAAALAGAAVVGQKHPMIAAGWAGGLIGSTGYHAGVALGGGMVGLSPQGALKGIADMAADDPEMAAMIAGLGEVDDDNSGGALGEAADEYNAALSDVEDDAMGDVVEAD